MKAGPSALLLMGSAGAFITGCDFLIDSGVTASYWCGALAPQLERRSETTIECAVPVRSRPRTRRNLPAQLVQVLHHLFRILVLVSVGIRVEAGDGHRANPFFRPGAHATVAFALDNVPVVACLHYIGLRPHGVVVQRELQFHGIRIDQAHPFHHVHAITMRSPDGLRYRLRDLGDSTVGIARRAETATGRNAARRAGTTAGRRTTAGTDPAGAPVVWQALADSIL